MSGPKRAVQVPVDQDGAKIPARMGADTNGAYHAASVVASQYDANTFGLVMVNPDGSVLGSPMPVTVMTKSLDYTVLAGDTGKVIIVTGVDKTMTLPATAAGLRYRFVLAAAGLSAGTGLQIAPQAADKIMGDGFTSAVNKAAVLAGSGDREGDSIELVGDGNLGWYIVSHEGTWTRAA